MRFDTPAASRVFAWQNILAGLVFTTLVAGDCLAWLLNLFPASEILWRVTVPLFKLTRAFSEMLGYATGNAPAVPFLLLLVSLALPLWAYAKRNLITTAALGHLSLAACVFMLASTVQRNINPRDVADLSRVFDPTAMSMSFMTLSLATLAMLGLCGLNHVFYFRQLMLRGK